MAKNNIFSQPETHFPSPGTASILQLSDASDKVIYTTLNASCCMVSGVRFVDSYEEIFTVSDDFNTTYNRFPLFTLFAGEHSFSLLEFSVYVNRNMKEFYLRFDDIPHKSLRLEGKPLPLSSCRVRFSSPDEDISEYADGRLITDLKDYYAGSWADALPLHLYFMDGDVDIKAVMAFGKGLKNIRCISTIIDCTWQDFKTKNLSEEEIPKPFTLPRSMYYAESLDGKYRYIRDHRFLWNHNSINKYLLEYPDNPFFIKLER